MRVARGAGQRSGHDPSGELTKPGVPSFLTSTWEIPADNLQQSLEKYMEEGNFSQPFNFVSSMPFRMCSR